MKYTKQFLTVHRVTDFHEHAVETYARSNLLEPCHN